MNTVLVTGGAGYIGSHTCNALRQAGFTPVTFDNLSQGHEWAVQWGPLEKGDLLDPAALDAVFARWRPAAVLHFAALSIVGESTQQPGRYYMNNVAGTLNLLQAMRAHGVGKLVFSSTCAIYGEPEVVPISEAETCKPISPYGASKWMIERILQDFDVAHGLRSISLRYFNAAGADPEARIGEAHHPETHLIPLVLAAAAGDRPEITIFGDQHGTPDGTCVRDYIHVADLAQAHVLALHALLAGARTDAFNLGNGTGFSVREVIDVARRVTGRPIPVQLGTARAGDAPRLVADSSRLQSALGWAPQRADIETIIEDAWRWFMKHRERP